MSVDEQTRKLGEALAAVRDGLQGLQPAIQAIDDFLSFLGERLEAPGNWDSSRIKWSQETGFKGPYEKAVPEGQPNDFRNLIGDLESHEGKLTRDGLFYWLFPNAEIVGRKKAA